MADKTTFTRELAPLAQDAKRRATAPINVTPSSSELGDVVSFAELGVGIASRIRASNELEGLVDAQGFIDQATEERNAISSRLADTHFLRREQGMSKVQAALALREDINSLDLSESDKLSVGQTVSDLLNSSPVSSALSAISDAEGEDPAKDPRLADADRIISAADNDVIFAMQGDSGIPTDVEGRVELSNKIIRVDGLAALSEAQQKAAESSRGIDNAAAVSSELGSIGTGVVAQVQAVVPMLLREADLAFRSGNPDTEQLNQIMESAGTVIDTWELQANQRYDQALAVYGSDSDLRAQIQAARAATTAQFRSWGEMLTNASELELRSTTKMIEVLDSRMKLTHADSLSLVSLIREAVGESLTTRFVNEIAVTNPAALEPVRAQLSSALTSLTTPQAKAAQVLDLANDLALFNSGQLSLGDVGGRATQVSAATYTAWRDAIKKRDWEGENIPQGQAALTEVLIFANRAGGEEAEQNMKNATSMINDPNFIDFLNQGTEITKRQLGEQALIAEEKALLSTSGLISDVRRLSGTGGVSLDANTGKFSFVDREEVKITGAIGTHVPVVNLVRGFDSRNSATIDRVNSAVTNIATFAENDPVLKDLSPNQRVSFYLQQAERLGLLRGVTVVGSFPAITDEQDIREAKSEGITVPEVLKRREQGERLDILQKKVDELGNAASILNSNPDIVEQIRALTANPDLTFDEVKKLQ